MKPIAPICLAFTVVLLASMQIKAENTELPPDTGNTKLDNTQYLGLEASLRYFEDTLIETSALLKKTHILLNSIEAPNTLSKGTPEYAICKLCGNYERLLAHIEHLIEGRLYATLLTTNWSRSIPEDLKRVHCFTWNVIQHLQISQGYAEITGAEDYHDSPCTDVETGIFASLDIYSKTRESLQLLEESIKVFKFRINLTRNEMLAF